MHYAIKFISTMLAVFHTFSIQSTTATETGNYILYGFLRTPDCLLATLAQMRSGL